MNQRSVLWVLLFGFAVATTADPAAYRHECETNLKNIVKVIDDFVRRTGDYPESLSKLADLGLLPPEYLSCPVPLAQCDDDTILAVKARTHDPGTRYSYEFSLFPLESPYEGETQRSFKQAQRGVIRRHGIEKELVPIVRCHCHGVNQHLNVTLNGDVYLSGLYWEEVAVVPDKGLLAGDLGLASVFPAIRNVPDVNESAERLQRPAEAGLNLGGANEGGIFPYPLTSDEDEVRDIPIKARAGKLVFLTARPGDAASSPGVNATFKIVREDGDNDEAQLFWHTPSTTLEALGESLSTNRWQEEGWVFQSTVWANSRPEVRIESVSGRLVTREMSLFLVNLSVVD